jgi:hypothetical protein
MRPLFVCFSCSLPKILYSLSIYRAHTFSFSKVPIFQLLELMFIQLKGLSGEI